MNTVKITGSPQRTTFANMKPGDLFIVNSLLEEGTIYMRLNSHKNSVDLSTGDIVPFKSSLLVERINNPQGVHIRGERLQ